MKTLKPVNGMRIATVDFSATDRCPLRCDFCYNRRAVGDAAPGHWSDARADAALELVRAQLARPTDRINWFWLGGEPLLVADKIMDWLARVRRETDANIRTSWTTNLVPFTDAILERAQHLNVMWHLSIDGCPEAHDIHRRTAKGESVSGKVFDAARKVLAVQPMVMARMTLTPRNVHLLARSVDWLATFAGEKESFKSIGFDTASGLRWPDDALDEYERQVKAAARWWVGQMRKGRFYRIDPLVKMLERVWRPIRNAHICDAAVRRVAVATDGSLWPCHYFVGFAKTNDKRLRQYQMGTLADGWSDGANGLRRRWFEVNNRRAWAETAGCADCPAVNGCHNYCPHKAICDGGDIDGLHHWRCREARALWRAAMWAHSTLMADGGNVERWYRRNFDPSMRPRRRADAGCGEDGDADGGDGQGAAGERKLLDSTTHAFVDLGRNMILAVPRDQLAETITLPREVKIGGAADVDSGGGGESSNGDGVGAAPSPAVATGRKSGKADPRHIAVVKWAAAGAPRMLCKALGQMESQGWRLSAFERSQSGWSEAACRLLQDNDPPAWFVVQQPLYLSDRDDKRVVEALRVSRETRLLVSDFGLIRHYASALFDRRGSNGASSVANGGFDRELARPGQREAAEAMLPEIDAWAARLREMGDGYEPSAELAALAENERGMAVFLGQRPGEMFLVTDADVEMSNPQIVAERLAASARRSGMSFVFKCHPFDKASDGVRGGGALTIARNADESLLAWLITRAKAVFLVNSSCVFQCLALDAPVVQLGRGWASGNGLVFERRQRTRITDWGALRRFDGERRRLFLALLLSRQWDIIEKPSQEHLRKRGRDLADPEAVARLFAFFDRLDGGDGAAYAPTTKATVDLGEKCRPPVFTAVYIPDMANRRYPDLPEIVARNLAAGPGGRRWVAVDKGCAELDKQLGRLDGIELFRPTDGKPPRMLDNMRRALETMPDGAPFVWTVEQDVELEDATALKAERIMAGLPDNVAALWLRAVDPETGEWCHPIPRDRMNLDRLPRVEPAPEAADGAGLRYFNRAPFHATLWRAAALRRITDREAIGRWLQNGAARDPWARASLAMLTRTGNPAPKDDLPQLHQCDFLFSAFLRSLGWVFVAATGLTVRHWQQSSYRTVQGTGRE